MINQKGITPIIIVLIVVAFLVGGFLVWQYFGVPKEKIEIPKEELVEDETADWKTYRNETYKYELKYPPNLEITIPSESSPIISWHFPIEDVSKLMDKSIRIEVKENIEKKSLRSASGYDPAFCKIEQEQDTFIRFSCEMEEGAIQMIESAYSRDDNVYMIYFSIMGWEDLTGMDFLSEIHVYNLILSTFKFTEGEVMSPPPQRSVKDIKVMADMTQIGAAAEIYYNKNGNYRNLASDKDVFNIQKQIQSEIGRWPGMITSNDAYCADVTLSDGKTKYCIDSEGRRGENLGCSSTKLICISY